MDRFEVVDMSDDDDPRFKIWDTDNSCYLPGYWRSPEDAIAGAYELMLQTEAEE